MLACGLVVAGCAEPSRPMLSEWEPRWEVATAVVDEARPSEAVPTVDACERALGELRDLRPETLPGPDALVDETVGAWFEDAEHLFFTCPQETAEYDRLSAELERREAEVTTALDGLGGDASG